MPPKQHVDNEAAVHDLGQSLAGRPASDLAWIVEEAARLAVRSGKDAIDEIRLASALRNLG
jgi:hypothetical protein